MKKIGVELKVVEQLLCILINMHASHNKNI